MNFIAALQRWHLHCYAKQIRGFWQPLSLVSMECCPVFVTTFSHLGELVYEEKGSVFPRNTSECDFTCFPGVLVAKKQLRLVLDLHAVSSTKPAILLWCPTGTQNCPSFWLTAFQCHLEESFTAATNSLFPATPLPCVLRNVSVAALEPLAGRRGRKHSPFAATCVIFPC